MKKILIYILVLAVISTAGYFVWAKWISRTGESNGMLANNGQSEIDYYHCGMHPQITSDKPGKCPICGMTLTPVYKTNLQHNDGIVQIDPAMVQNIGVKTEIVMQRKLTHTIRTTGRVDYDETKQTYITTKFSGWIEKLYVDYTGKPVQKGQLLFEVYSPELVAVQQEYLQAKHYSSVMKSANDSVFQRGANDLLRSANKKLMYWDISSAQIKELELTGNVKKTLTIYSPFSGIIIEKNIFEGMQIQAGTNLLKLADISEMWVYADVYENELSRVRKGDSVELELPYNAGKSLHGKVSYIYPYLQDETRTVKVRIDFANEIEALKKDMYVTVKIIPTISIDAIAVPEQAVIHSGSRNVIVLSLGDGKFKSVDVKLGALSDGYYEVLEGISEGELIVTSSQFLIDSESNLKAGLGGMQMPGMDMEGIKSESKDGHEQLDESRKSNSPNQKDTSMKDMKM